MTRSPNFIPFAAASLVTVCARLCAPWENSFPWPSQKCRPVPRFLTGRFPRSGTFVTPGSRIPKGRRLLISRNRICTSSITASRFAARVAQVLSQIPLRYSYRFLWIPGTIGSITWLALNEAKIPNIKHGLVLSCLGDCGHFTYKRSRRGDAEIDRAVACILRDSAKTHELIDFTPYGYDERQYCSPGINLPVGCFMRTPNGRYPEYHSSADNLNFISAAGLADSAATLLSIIEVLEANDCYVNLNPKCEPQLGRRGLYRAMGGTNSS